MNIQRQVPKSIAIMQPTFLPWIGYFSLIDCVDEFVFFDHVQFEKRSWQQRNKIRTPNQEMWLSVPISSKGKQSQAIKDAEILYDGKKSPFKKIMGSIEANYKKAPYYKDYGEELNVFFQGQPKFISDLNQDVIRWMCGKLAVATPIVRSSDLDVIGTKADLLVDVCQARKAMRYVSTPGSKVYLDESDAFELSGISLSYHEYVHPSYSQIHGEFVPFMSVLDLLFNEGPASGEIMRSGRNDT